MVYNRQKVSMLPLQFDILQFKDDLYWKWHNDDTLVAEGKSTLEHMLSIILLYCE